MPRRRLAGLLAAALAGGGFFACSQDEPVAPGASQSMPPGHQMTGDVSALALFPFRGALDPFKIHQLPDFMMHSKTTTDLVVQNLTFTPGPGMWHFHPGPSFVAVISGQIKVERVTEAGCVESPVHIAGDAYFEGPFEIHRAVVVSTEDAVLLVTRFIPPGQAITTNVDPPDCS